MAMNIKILHELENMFKASPQLLCDKNKLNQAIQGTFSVDVTKFVYTNYNELADHIDELVLEKYFSEVWQSRTKKYKYSGLKLIDEINSLNPKAVLDVGCGYNEFKGKIQNLIGIDPYNDKADVKVKVTDYYNSDLFNAVICLGSINFGSSDKIFAELDSVVRLTAPGGKIYFRVNPGMQQPQLEAKWITFYPWESTFIINCADYFGVEILELRNDSNGRMYFVWEK